jgi:3-oxoacyl-[acyl-carrier protein] reductase
MTNLERSGTSIEGHRILVVGAASGIGQATAEVLESRGAVVVRADRDAAGLHSAGGDRPGMLVDITEAGIVGPAIDALVDAGGPLDALVNCAGVTGTTNVRSHEVSVEELDAVYAVNLRGAFALSRAVLPHMAERGYGRILHLASIAGKEGNAGMVAYSATKAGLIGMVKTMGKEYATTGVTVNAVAPGVIRTPMVAALPQEQVDYMTAKIPMGRCGTLQEISDLIAWVVSPASSFTTGFTFDLSGGRAVY